MPKKILVVYYSRTGTTKKIAELLAEKLNSDLEEIKSAKNYRGIWGYLIAGREAMLKKPTDLAPVVKNPADYDLIVIGTPVWAGNVSSPVRTYLMRNKNDSKNIACFCVMGGSGDERTLAEMENIFGQKSIAAFSLLTKEVIENKAEEKIEEFVNKIR